MSSVSKEGYVLGVRIQDVGNPAVFELLRETLEAFPVNNCLPTGFMFPWGILAEIEVLEFDTSESNPEIKVKISAENRSLCVHFNFVRFADYYMRVISLDLESREVPYLSKQFCFLSAGVRDLNLEGGFRDMQNRYYIPQEKIEFFSK